MNELETVFTGFVRLLERVCKDGCALNLKNFRQDLAAQIDGFAAALKPERKAAPEATTAYTRFALTVRFGR